jgi:holo-[acyl-carrier protein] synthase
VVNSKLTTLVLRTGIDMIEISRLDEIQPGIKSRFLQRVFTLLELTECQGNSASLAGRFAAKEAVAKALGCGIGPISWFEIEILRGASGEPCLKLYGKAESMANDMGLSIWSVSITHTREYAIASVVASGELVKESNARSG